MHFKLLVQLMVSTSYVKWPIRLMCSYPYNLHSSNLSKSGSSSTGRIGLAICFFFFGSMSSPKAIMLASLSFCLSLSLPSFRGEKNHCNVCHEELVNEYIHLYYNLYSFIKYSLLRIECCLFNFIDSLIVSLLRFHYLYA